MFWAVSTLIFLLTVTLGFMLFRDTVKLYLERQRNREGSRIKTKLVFGALALSLLPVVFLVLFSYVILNRNVEKWFSAPRRRHAHPVAGRSGAVSGKRCKAARTRWRTGSRCFPKCERHRGLRESLPRKPDRSNSGSIHPRGSYPVRLQRQFPLCSLPRGLPGPGILWLACGRISTSWKSRNRSRRYMNEYNQLAAQRRSIRYLVFCSILLIALFILFVATWIALLLAKQISLPISALLVAASQVRKGNLSYRVNVPANDELATLVRGFNEMMHGLEDNSRELESRRRFHRSYSRKHPHRRDLPDRRRPHPAGKSRAARSVPARAGRARRHLSDLFPPSTPPKFAI